MKLLLDVNVFMDVLERREGWVDSLAIIRYCQQKDLDGYISALTIPIIYFLRRRRFTENQSRSDTLTITAGMQIVPMTAEILTRAYTSPLPDFEDNIQLFSAQQISADYIITRNKKDFAQAGISVASPDEFLKEVARRSVS